MYEWTVQEGVIVSCLVPDASAGMFTMNDYTKSVVVSLPAWDSVGTVSFNGEKWFTGYGQSQLRHMIEKAREVHGDVLYAKTDQIMADSPDIEFVKDPEPRNEMRRATLYYHRTDKPLIDHLRLEDEDHVFLYLGKCRVQEESVQVTFEGGRKL